MDPAISNEFVEDRLHAPVFVGKPHERIDELRTQHGVESQVSDGGLEIAHRPIEVSGACGMVRRRLLQLHRGGLDVGEHVLELVPKRTGRFTDFLLEESVEPFDALAAWVDRRGNS